MKIDAITVCVNYADFLKHAISNKECFNRWLIVTVKQDKDTIKICEDNDLEYCFSDRVSQNGEFHKGKAINDGLLVLDPQDWICLIDADTILRPKAFNKVVQEVNFDTDHLVGLHGRYQVDDTTQLDTVFDKQISVNELDDKNLLIGFFQMWHVDMRKFYPEDYPHAGGDDITMRESFHENNWRFLPSYAVHLGPKFKNHKGRISGQFI